jgi:hypothetical protein
MVMTDIFQSWKDRRFIIAAPDIVDNERIVVLTDVAFWTEHINDLIEWCNDTPGTTNEGMTVVFDTDEALTMFVLRWS